MTSLDSLTTRRHICVGEAEAEIFDIRRIDGSDRLPYSMKILLENLLRTEDGRNVTIDHICAVASWDPTAQPGIEIQFTPARVLMQDFTGVPCLVDLAAMRDAVIELGGDPMRVTPLTTADLVIDHSIIAEFSGTPDALTRNVEREYRRNRERYQFLRWGQSAFDGFTVIPPGKGIVHQVNIERLTTIVVTNDGLTYPDTVIGTDSHTTMVNGLGVLGWGVGGIEAEAAMLGQPVSMLIPRVVGFRLTGHLPEGVTSTDLVLTITEILRQHGVVGSFVEFYGPGLTGVPLATRATISTMSPEYGSTISLFPIDDETIRYAKLTDKDDVHIALIQSYAQEQGLWHDPYAERDYSQRLELDLSTVEPCLAGPSRPHDRVSLASARRSLPPPPTTASPTSPVPVTLGDGTDIKLDHGAVVIAAITSCTNTSHPDVMIGAALLARNAVKRGLRSKPWVKTSLAPGSRVVMDYYHQAGLTEYLDKLGFHLVGYGCTTCIGNSGSLPLPISTAIAAHGILTAAVLSGNRNFEGRINPAVAMNYLASPPLVVAYALTGTMNIDLTKDPIGVDTHGQSVFLRDIWPSSSEIAHITRVTYNTKTFAKAYSDIFVGDRRWHDLPVQEGKTFAWDDKSTYIRQPPYFRNMPLIPLPVRDMAGMRVLVKLGDCVTTDHISPAGSIPIDSPAGQYLTAHGITPEDFNSYGSRRGNHDVMIRGTFTNIRLRNHLVGTINGGFTINHLTGKMTTIYDASVAYATARTPLLLLAGKEYGSGSSRDWAAKGTALLGVRAVIAESYERIHRSNLIGMGVLPLEYPQGQNADILGLTGMETYTISGIEAISREAIPRTVQVSTDTGLVFNAIVRIDTLGEAEYYRHGGILPYVLRQMVHREAII